MVAVIMEYANIVGLNVYKIVKAIGLKFRREKMNLLKTFRGNFIEELQYKKAKWIISLAPAVIFIEKEEYVPGFFFWDIKLKVYFY